jgi:hypothetical protein
MVFVMATTVNLLKAKAALLTVILFGVGVLLFSLEGRPLPEGMWIISTYGCFAASTLFGIVAARQGKTWPLIFSVLSALIIIVTVIGVVFIGGV